MKFKQVIIFLFLVCSSLLASAPAQAAFGDALRQYYGETVERVYRPEPAQNIETTLPRAIGNIISLFLSFVGLILLVIIVYAGFLWLTAQGNEEQVTKAKSLLKNGIIGLVIILGSYVISSFIVFQVDNALRART